MSIQVTYETDHTSVLCHWAISKCTKFLFFMYFIEILKEKYCIKRNINCKKEKSLYVKPYYYFDLPKIRVVRACTIKN